MNARRGLFGSKSSSKGAGALDEETFVQSFEQVPQVTIYSARDLADYMNKIKDILSGSVEDWEKRVDHLRLLRSVVIAGGPQYEEFTVLLRALEIPFQTCVSDLRSLVVREACISVGFLAQELKLRFDRFAEMILPSLIILMNNSAKVMATSGIHAVRFILLYTHSPRLLPIITSSLSSKSNATRRFASEFLEAVCRDWPTNALEKQLGLLQESIKKSINDADQDARAYARRAFCEFAKHFPDQAEAMLSTMEPAKRKLIEKDLAAAGMSFHGNGADSGPARPTTLHKEGKRTVRSAVGGKRVPSDAGSTGRTRVGSNTQAEQQQPRGRQPVKKMVSQSQPTSREVSPSSRTSYLSYGAAGDRRTTKSRIPRSQGTSREGSPSRSGIPTPGQGSGFQRRVPGRASLRTRNVIGQPVLSQDPDAEHALADALARGRRRFEDSDDASETSSICSETSYRGPAYRTSENVQDILAQLNSAQWIDRKDGLINFQNYMRSRQPLNSTEIRKFTEVFTKMFHDTQTKVIALFLDTLQLFVKEYNTALHDWLYILLVRLLTKHGNEVLSSQQKRIEETLFVVRSYFPVELQFEFCCKYVVDPTQTPSLKVKACLLEFMKDLLLLLSPEIVSDNSADVKMAISKVIAWTVEPKSSEVRKTASRLIMKLFDLNTTGFSAMMQTLPRHFQEKAYKVLHTYMDLPTDESPTGPAPSDMRSRNTSNSSQRSSLSRTNSLRRRQQYDQQDSSADQTMQYRSVGGAGDYPDAISPEDINQFIRQTTDHIQKLAGNYDQVEHAGASSAAPTHHQQRRHHQQHHGGMGPSRDRDATSTDSGIQNSYPDLHGDVFEGATNGAQPPHTDSRRYNPNYYQQDKVSQPPGNNYDMNHDASPLVSPKSPLKMPPEDVMGEILQEMSNHNERYEERKACMLNLIKMLREGTVDTWDEHFKTTLLLLLETLGDDQGETRALALRVLQELLRGQPDRFHEYTHLTIVKILEAHKDQDKSVVRSAEECAQVLASTLPRDLCLRVLTPIVMDSEYQINLAALKIENQAIKFAEQHLVDQLLPELVKGLIKGTNHKESHIRKASIFCLVEIYLQVGDKLWPYLKELNNSKIRLLNLYIQRTRDNVDNMSSSGRSNVTSPNPS